MVPEEGKGQYGDVFVQAKTARPFPTGNALLLCHGYNAPSGCTRQGCIYRNHCVVLSENGHACDKQNPCQEHKDDVHGKTTAV